MTALEGPRTAFPTTLIGAPFCDDIIVAYGITSPVYYNEITGDMIVKKQVLAANRSG